MEHVRITVSGGVAELLSRTGGVKVEIIDYDNGDDDERACRCEGEGGSLHSHETYEPEAAPSALAERTFNQYRSINATSRARGEHNARLHGRSG
jgi:hypothetical protein